MFSSIGWGEIFVIVVLGVLIVGPERLPGVIQDARAAIYAARKAINNAKAELNGEMGEISKEFEELRGPISTAAEWGRMGPRTALTKALFDGDDSAWDDFDPRKPARPANPAAAAQPSQPMPPSQATPPTQPAAGAQATGAGFDYSQIYSEPVQPPRKRRRQPGLDPNPRQASPQENDNGNNGDVGFSWADIT